MWSGSVLLVVDLPVQRAAAETPDWHSIGSPTKARTQNPYKTELELLFRIEVCRNVKAREVVRQTPRANGRLGIDTRRQRTMKPTAALADEHSLRILL